MFMEERLKAALYAVHIYLSICNIKEEKVMLEGIFVYTYKFYAKKN